MLVPGLVSVTFRKLPVEEIIQITKRAGLEVIEWGGDIHVPHGDYEKAKYVHSLMEESNLTTSAYGSYFHVGKQDVNDFKAVLETARQLNAPTIRIWAGGSRSGDASEKDWEMAVRDTIRISEWASEYGIDLAFEYHDHTLTDTAQSAIELMVRINRPNVYLYWQPPVGMPIEERLSGLKLVLPYLKNIHVFQWKVHDRLPLEEGWDEWKLYLSHVPTESTHYCSLEFVKDDNPEQLKKDAEALLAILQSLK